MVDLLLDYLNSTVKALEKAKGENKNESVQYNEQIFINADDSQSEQASLSLKNLPKYVFYENEIQILEAEVRSHIRLEQQLKLHIDTTEAKNEELERDLMALTFENESLVNQMEF